jgi:MFS family permease
MHESNSATKPPEPGPAAPAAEHPYAVFQNRDFRRFLLGRLAASMGTQMLTVAVDWELYQRTHSTLALGFVGLAFMVPMILCTLPAGHLADHFNRKKIILAASVLTAVTSLGLALISWWNGPVAWIYACLVVLGVARTFLWPASAAFLPGLLPRPQFPRGVTYNSGVFQLSSVLGPAIGGVLYAVTGSAAIIYVLNVLAAMICFALMFFIPNRQTPAERQPVTVKSLATGFSFVYQNKIILGTITLDMFAVLLGGAVSLLPFFAGDILKSGADGLGLLRAAMPIGAVVCALWLAHRPPLLKAGRAMLLAVGVFGLATILFGLGNPACLGQWLGLTALPAGVWFWFAFAMLAVCGGVDNVSVVVRQTLVQILTPDEKRGRVSAVNSLFIGTSNELGGFESGLVAWLGGAAIGRSNASGAIFSVVTGGIGTIIVVLAVARIWPEIRRYGKLA